MKKKGFEKWINIGKNEKSRTYIYPDGFQYTIKNPKKLFVKKSGSHKIVDKNGVNHYITKGFRVIRFKGKYAFNVE